MSKLTIKKLQSKWQQVLLMVVALLFVAGLVTVITRYRTRPETGKAVAGWEQPDQPVRAAWYFAWFFENTQDPIKQAHRGLDWGHWSPYVPQLAQTQGHSYGSKDPSTYQQHIRDLVYGKFDVALYSWRGQQDNSHSRCSDDLGPGNGFSTTDTTQCLFGRILEDTRGTLLKWAVEDEYENYEGAHVTLAQTKANLQFFRDHFFNRPTYFKIHGKPVVTIWTGTSEQCAMNARWAQAQRETGIDIYLNTRVTAPGWDTCATQPEMWFKWDVGSPLVKNGEYLSDSIRPGFWDPIDNQYNTDADHTSTIGGNQFSKYVRRDPAGWPAEVRRQVNSPAKWQFTETFNDWGEGHSVEPAVDCTARDVATNIVGQRTEGTDRCPPHQNGWQTSSGYGLYLDALHNNPAHTAGSAPTVSLTTNAGDNKVLAGTNVTLTWTTTNANACTGTIDGGNTGWAGDKNKDGGNQTLTVGATRVFTITCTNDNGEATDNVTVNVGPAPSLTLAASPSDITSGQSSTLTWVVNDATVCTGSGGVTGSGWNTSQAAADGQHTKVISSITATTTYTLSCSNDYANTPTVKTTVVNVGSPPAVTVTFTVTKTTMKAGESAVLNWSSTNATTCDANGSWNGTKATSGNLTVNPINDVLYNLTCTGPGGSNSANTGIDVTSSGKVGDVNNPPNGDGVINNADLSYLLSKFGISDTRCDLNHDGTVTNADLALLLTKFGT